jgi:hypothetical protein
MTIRSLQIGLTLATATLLLALSPAIAADAKQPPADQSAAPAIDQKAMDALERSRAYLRTLSRFELRAAMTIDDVEDNDFKLEEINRVRYDFDKPNKLFIEWLTDRRVREVYFDGQSMTLFAPRTGFYATIHQPGTVADMLDTAEKDHGIVLPLPDIFKWAVRSDPVRNLEMAQVVGYAEIAGVDTDQYAFRQPDIDWQIWIQRGDKPLWRKIVITARDDPTKPKVSALLGWDLTPTFAADLFTFKPPPGTASVGLVTLKDEGTAK